MKRCQRSRKLCFRLKLITFNTSHTLWQSAFILIPLFREPGAGSFVNSHNRKWSPVVARRFAVVFPDRKGSHKTLVIGYSWSASATLTKSYGEFGPSSDLSPKAFNAKTCNCRQHFLFVKDVLYSTSLQGTNLTRLLSLDVNLHEAIWSSPLHISAKVPNFSLPLDKNWFIPHIQHYDRLSQEHSKISFVGQEQPLVEIHKQLKRIQQSNYYDG